MSHTIRTAIVNRIAEVDADNTLTAAELGQRLRSVVGPHIGGLVPQEVVWAVEDLNPRKSLSAEELADGIVSRFGLANR